MAITSDRQLPDRYDLLHYSGEIYRTNVSDFSFSRDSKTLIILCGASGCGKTTFCNKYLKNYGNVINLDDIVEEYLSTDPDVFEAFSVEANARINMEFLKRAKESLRLSTTILDFRSVDPEARWTFLKHLHGSYSESILIVLDVPLKQILSQIEKDMETGIRIPLPMMLKDSYEEYLLLQEQLDTNDICIGIDKVFLLNKLD